MGTLVRMCSEMGTSTRCEYTASCSAAWGGDSPMLPPLPSPPHSFSMIASGHGPRVQIERGAVPDADRGGARESLRHACDGVGYEGGM